LKILPLRKDAPIYIAPEKRPKFDENGEAIGIRGVRAIPVYETSVKLEENRRPVELRSPQFVYGSIRPTGLRGQSWENRLTGKTISLGKGPEVEL